MEKIWLMDKREFLLKKDCIITTNQYIILYMVVFFGIYTLFSNRPSYIINNKGEKICQ